ncbi:hypothetical protein MtrunA17_Chr5g0439171 [Medicago truncatula]|uniref:Uncharacterized protein n=1 Tax=Medicago truncatula TaxID=3880 RepID=A0A396HVJ4_MEDTR|nr:hypothetical protein MtrunA17_Chr5g0439171 [Medicago truncatula]
MCPPLAATCKGLSLFLLNVNKSFGECSITRFTMSLLPYEAAICNTVFFVGVSISNKLEEPNKFVEPPYTK